MATNLNETIDGLTAFMDASELHGFTVKEWSTTQFTKLYPYLSTVTKELVKGGASLDNISSYLKENLSLLVDAVAPHMVPIILLSCPGSTQEQLDKLSWTAGIEVVLLIVKKNMEHIADFFDRKSVQLENLKKMDLTTNS